MQAAWEHGELSEEAQLGQLREEAAPDLLRPQSSPSFSPISCIPVESSQPQSTADLDSPLKQCPKKGVSLLAEFTLLNIFK